MQMSLDTEILKPICVSDGFACDRVSEICFNDLKGCV